MLLSFRQCCNFVYTENNASHVSRFTNYVGDFTHGGFFLSIEQIYLAIDQRNFGCLENEGINSSLFLFCFVFIFPSPQLAFLSWFTTKFFISANWVPAILYFVLINPTYRDAEVVKRIAVTEFFRVVVHVRREKLTKKFIVDIRWSLYIERKTSWSFQTGQRALWHVINKTFTKGSDIQVGEFVFLEVCITEGITRSTSAYSNLWHSYL